MDQLQTAKGILDKDIELHRNYLRLAGSRLGEPGFDLPSLVWLGDDILDKERMKRMLDDADPSRYVLDRIIDRLGNYYIPAHERSIDNPKIPAHWRNREHNEEWIKNYGFLKEIFQTMRQSSTRE